ncbi:MAG TPA: hypothetical protein PLD49_02510 [Thermoclostridium caenicola]|uniref:Uncharacterized protein n=1 Tax=Thermoclostridium caenicola TaxID=659425 RepID=A0A1M6HFL6_9FIRM|nr:hypothetical protein [Thermoclostridium caenicola]SHJ20965.1 hypothetical protein SAMN05444373_10329 [Thermoclostridium caenicola]HOK42525.1 hypothetical protein [Thermoclostridium caenicola]HOL85429.1 hypothetical protein [Thermoclostridium caenicola]HPO76688.1 hypothetical protein [Thermoclostridium caenicola]
MKEHITPQDLQSLTASQKEMLRSLWKPEVNQMAVASICTNVETEEYKDIEFVIGQVLIVDSGRFPRIVLRRLRLTENENGEDGDTAPESDAAEDIFDEEPDGDAYDGDFDALYIEPDEFFNLEDCLPLLSIGQMIDYIRKSKFGQRGFKLLIPPEEGKLFEQNTFRLEDSDEETYENAELCDLLWDIFKSYVLGVL